MGLNGFRGSAAISCVGVSKAFRTLLRQKQVLKGLSFAADEGEAIGIVGANGVGKTTLLLLILGHLGSDAGTISVLGAPPGDPSVRGRIGWMPDQPWLPPAKSGRDLLEFWLRGHGADNGEHRIARFASAFGMSEALSGSVADYSLGMRRKLSFALATLHEPVLVVLDEPFIGIDPAGQEALIEDLERRRREGVTVVMSSHQERELLRAVESVVELTDGVVCRRR